MTLLRDLSMRSYSVSVVEGQQVGGRIKILYASEMWGGKRQRREGSSWGRVGG